MCCKGTTASHKHIREAQRMRNETLHLIIEIIFYSNNQFYFRTFQQQIYEILSIPWLFPRSRKTLMGECALLNIHNSVVTLSLFCFFMFCADLLR